MKSAAEDERFKRWWARFERLVATPTAYRELAEVFRNLDIRAVLPSIQAPTLLLHAPAYGLVRDEQLAAYADRVEAVAVPGMHVVMWDAFDEVAGAVERFLAD